MENTLNNMYSQIKEEKPYRLNDIKITNFEYIQSHVNKVLYIIFFLLLTEGILRKWLLPSLDKPLFFIKDIFILYLYLYLALKRKFPANIWSLIALMFMFLFLLLINIHYLVMDLPVLVGFYGWRNYVLYIPLAFIIQTYVNNKALKNIGKMFLWGSIPITIIAFFQYLSPKDAYINKNVGLNTSSEIFIVADGVVRPSGTFAFTTGLVLFTGALFIFIIYNFFLKKEKVVGKLFFYISVFSLIASIALSGSRSAYVSLGGQIAFLTIGSLLLLRKREGFNIISYIITGSVLFLLVYNTFFEKQKDLILKRQEIATNAEGSIFNRLSDMVINLEAINQSNLSPIGAGLGLGSGGGSHLALGVNQFTLSETEWGRNLLEAGVFLGVSYILFRLALTLYLLFESIKTLIYTSNPTPLVAFFYVGVNLFIGPTTGNGLTYSFTWIFLGVALAINKVILENKKSQTLNKLSRH
ncbi:MAG: hypothetical protein EAZ07_08670 [Cytophagales bacterium]|nr:MAG: hypothetical protein EAZ07_08670 [Cytophagales bacterium]